MDKFEIAVVVSNQNKTVSLYETIDAIKKAGYKKVFLQWYNNKDWEVSQEEQLRYSREQGLEVIFAHLAYRRINEIWLEEETDIVNYYKKDIENCSKNNIPMVVMHLTDTEKPPMYNERGLKRIKDICEYAKSLGVKVAFENTKVKGYLDYVIDNINDDNVGICFDSGHYHTHFNDDLDFEKFKNRIFAIHLHDNDQSGDQHLLPFDGTLDWDDTINKLKNSNYEGPITLEIHYRNDYLNNTLDDFYGSGYERGIKIRDLFLKNNINK